jgi:tetratricopeptide (TPR) repeat protein
VPNLVGPDQLSWLNRLDADHPNLRAALRHLRETAPPRAVRMTGYLGWFWDTRGYPPEVLRQLSDVLATAAPDSPSRGGPLFWAGRFAWMLGDAAAGRRLLLEALPLVDEGEERLAVLILSHLAMADYALGDRARGAAYHRQSIAAARASGDNWALGVALQNCAATAPHYAAYPPTAQDIERAIAMFEEALAFLRPVGEPRTIALATRNLAAFVTDAGDLTYAEQLIEEALAVSRELQFPMNIVAALINRALISLQRGDQRSASDDLGEAIQTGLGSDVEEELKLLSATAILAAMRGEATEAAKLWAAADHARGRIGFREQEAVARMRATWQQQAQAEVGDSGAWEAAWQTGSGLTIHDALALAARITRDSVGSSTGTTPDEQAVEQGSQATLSIGATRRSDISTTTAT